MLWITAALGVCFVGIQWGLRDAPLLWFAALRALVGGTALAVVAGIAGLATGTAAVLANAQPLLVLLPGWWLFGERVSARAGAALAVGFGGLLVVAVPGGGGRGAWLSLLAAAAAVTAGTLLVRRMGGVDVVVLSAGHLLFGGLVLAGVAAAVEGAPRIDWTLRFVLVLAFLGLVATAATTLAGRVDGGRNSPGPDQHAGGPHPARGAQRRSGASTRCGPGSQRRPPPGPRRSARRAV